VVLAIIKGLNRGETVSYQGRHFGLDSVAMRPQSVQPGGVPILLACHGRFPTRETQIRRAARWADGVISISDTPDEYGQVVRDVRGLAADLGRDPGSLEATMYLTVNLDHDIARGTAEAEQWLLGYYGADIWGSRWGPFGDPSRTTERIAEYAEAGADTVIVRFASFQPEKQLDTFLNEVAPVFR
jgi:alkanesulfonate monooxygenase SsuD/methylene tetrahydromethanopterin reductase-like flavin-dependent oxidoreductase (luciferase family)